MAEQLFHPIEPSSPATIPDTTLEPFAGEVLSSTENPLQASIMQSTPEADKAPAWFNQTVQKITDA